MPVSKKRKKNGKKVKSNDYRRARRVEKVADEQMTGVTLQDLINVLAYQEYVKDGTIVPDEKDIPTIADIDFDDPDVAAVINAVDKASHIDENEEN